ncbi:DUF2530 domain-containing protein [Tsukamurella strandjordii]|uniref:DUF2530 domain-containing protein n=1 Tax=Tsukamurella TaxID=2060 RepID=UPI001C7CD276|nr:DUF2530 domain-containing protein [Tsukamurella sp. TY48]GIZ96410.1 hypothetical protein TTY48_10220 [Tsukamurella sp. TY48]
MTVSPGPAEEAVTPPELPHSLTEPRPVVIIGTVLFAISLIVTLAARETFGDAWITCACGVGVGLLGAAVLTAQRRAARRGDRGAQRGLS